MVETRKLWELLCFDRVLFLPGRVAIISSAICCVDFGFHCSVACFVCRALVIIRARGRWWVTGWWWTGCRKRKEMALKGCACARECECEGESVRKVTRRVRKWGWKCDFTDWVFWPVCLDVLTHKHSKASLPYMRHRLAASLWTSCNTCCYYIKRCYRTEKSWEKSNSNAQLRGLIIGLTTPQI